MQSSRWRPPLASYSTTAEPVVAATVKRVVDGADSVIERLIRALAAQVGASGSMGLTVAARSELTELTRAEASLIYGIAGHLVHYGEGTVRPVIEAITQVQRDDSPADAALRPGDHVSLVGLPTGHLSDCDESWIRQTPFVVRFVGDDGTVDVQPPLVEDYFVATVDVGDLVRWE